MHKRVISMLFSLLLMLSAIPVSAETTHLPSPAERLATLDIIIQRDERFLGKDFDYMETRFYEQGCLPSSVYNALIAVVGTPDTDPTALLPEMIVSMSDPKKIRTSMMIIEKLPEALNDPVKNPALAALVADVNSVIEWSSLRNVDATLQEINALGGHSILMIDKLNITENWEQLVTLILQLNSMGYGNARIAFSSVGAGYTSFYEAPFGSGEYGHYIALYLQVDEFCSTGTFYLLDSTPRAMLGETWGLGTPFYSRYAFATHKDIAFYKNFVPERITLSVIRFTLREGELLELENLLTDPTLTSDARMTKLVKLHKRHMESVIVFGVNQAMLYIP